METLLKSESRDHEHLVSFLFHAATLYTGCGDAGVRGGQELSVPGRVSLDDVRVHGGQELAAPGRVSLGDGRELNL